MLLVCLIDHIVFLVIYFREQLLKKRLALVHDSLNTALSDNTSHKRDNGEQIARLTQAHRWMSQEKSISIYLCPDPVQSKIRTCGCLLFQQSLEFVPTDSEEVQRAGVEAGAEGGCHDGQWRIESCRGSPGVETGRDCSVILWQPRIA